LVEEYDQFVALANRVVIRICTGFASCREWQVLRWHSDVGWRGMVWSY
jgi:hypothetical protein